MNDHKISKLKQCIVDSSIGQKFICISKTSVNFGRLIGGFDKILLIAVVKLKTPFPC